MSRPNPFPKEFTNEELTDWLNTLDTSYTIGIMEKLYKDFRDYSLSIINNISKEDLS